MRVPPDFLDIELNTAAQIDWRIFFIHAEALVMIEGLKRSAVVAYIVKAPLNYDEVFVHLRRRAPIPMILVA
jgi:hypothetical protein